MRIKQAGLPRRQAGQTLIEVLVALAIIVVIVTSITIAVITALNNAEFVKSQNLATHYSQQGMEIVRFMRNTNYGQFITLNGSYCLADTCPSVSTLPGDTTCGRKTLTNCPANVNSIYVREIIVDNPSSLCTTGSGVTSIVSWADNKCTNRSDPYCHKVKLFSCFSAGGVVPTP